MVDDKSTAAGECGMVSGDEFTVSSKFDIWGRQGCGRRPRFASNALALAPAGPGATSERLPSVSPLIKLIKQMSRLIKVRAERRGREKAEVIGNRVA